MGPASREHGPESMSLWVAILLWVYFGLNALTLLLMAANAWAAWRLRRAVRKRLWEIAMRDEEPRA